MMTILGFMRGVLGLASTAPVAIRGAAQDSDPRLPAPDGNDWSKSKFADTVISMGAADLYVEYRSSTAPVWACASQEDAEAFLKWMECNKCKIRKVVIA